MNVYIYICIYVYRLVLGTKRGDYDEDMLYIITWSTLGWLHSKHGRGNPHPGGQSV